MNLPHPIRLAAAPLALAFAFVTGAPAFAHHTDNRTDAFSCKSDNNAGLKRTELVSKLLPATVSVNKVQAETIRTPRRDGSVGDVPTETPQLNGSGVVIDSENGYIVTNYHVVDKEEKLSITLYSKTGRNSRGAAYPVRVVGRDERSDLVVLQVTGKDTPQLPCLPIGDSAAVEAGEEIIAIGTPMALHFSVTSGIVSAVNRRHDTAKGGILNMIQVDTAINPGNSGGLLANMNGEIIGINTIKFMAAEGIAFAIDAATIRNIASQLILHGEVKRGKFGISGVNLNDDLMKQAGLARKDGAFVVSVAENSAAEKAGIKQNDVILSIGGHAIPDMEEVKFLIDNTLPGTRLDIKLWREGKTITSSATIEEPKIIPVAAPVLKR